MKGKFIWLAAAAMVTLVMLARLAQPAVAQTSSQPSTKIVSGPVSWTLTPAQCSSIDATISGVGKRLEVDTTRTLADGTKESIASAFVTGTATDTKGGNYYFTYTNQDRHLVPQGGKPVQVYMIDTFDLNGSGDNSLNLAFDWTWTYRAPAEQEWPPVHNWHQIQTVGDPLHCDPL